MLLMGVCRCLVLWGAVLCECFDHPSSDVAGAGVQGMAAGLPCLASRTHTLAVYLSIYVLVYGFVREGCGSGMCNLLGRPAEFQVLHDVCSERRTFETRFPSSTRTLLECSLVCQARGVYPSFGWQVPSYLLRDGGMGPSELTSNLPHRLLFPESLLDRFTFFNRYMRHISAMLAEWCFYLLSLWSRKIRL